MDIVLSTEQKAKVTIRPRTAAGKEAQIEGNVNFELLSGDATIEPDPEDGRTARLVPSDLAGTSVIRASGDADLGEGVRTVSVEINLIAADPQAESLGVDVELENK